MKKPPLSLREDLLKLQIDTGCNNSPLINASDHSVITTDEGVRLFRVSPAFKVIALAEPPTPDQMWLTTEVLSMFRVFLPLEPYPLHRMLETAKENVQPGQEELFAKLESVLTVPSPVDPKGPATTAGRANGSVSLTPRQLRRILRAIQSNHVSSAEMITDWLRRALLVPFLPATQRKDLSETLDQLSASQGASSSSVRSTASKAEPLEVVQEPDGTLRIGGISYNPHLGQPATSETPSAGALSQRPQVGALIPKVSTFFVVPSQLRVMQQILAELSEGEKYFLLIGNQGTGKNKCTDRLLEWLSLGREYLQLHRDSTVQSLTMTPSVSGGKMHWELSPLLKAAVEGHVAVVDEADKAPLEVVCVLKAILSDGHLSLPNGQVLRARPDSSEIAAAKNDDGKVLWIHKDFKCFVLANRPGYPFLGNDLYRECGDALSCHILENPDAESELHLLRSYAPNVDVDVLVKLGKAFSILRQKATDGEISYPFSARELVGIAKHLERFPRDTVGDAVANVFSFDYANSTVLATVKEELERAGVVLDARGEYLGTTENIDVDEWNDDALGNVPLTTRALKSSLTRLRELIAALEGYQHPAEANPTASEPVAIVELSARNCSFEIGSDLRVVKLLNSWDARSSGNFSELTHSATIEGFASSSRPFRKPIRLLHLNDRSSGRPHLVLVCSQPNSVYLMPLGALGASVRSLHDSLHPATIHGAEQLLAEVRDRDNIRELEMSFMTGKITDAVVPSFPLPSPAPTQDQPSIPGAIALFSRLHRREGDGEPNEENKNKKDPIITLSEFPSTMVILSLEDATYLLVDPIQRRMVRVHLPDDLLLGFDRGTQWSRLGRRYIDAEDHLLYGFSADGCFLSIINRLNGILSIIFLLTGEAITAKVDPELALSLSEPPQPHEQPADVFQGSARYRFPGAVSLHRTTTSTESSRSSVTDASISGGDLQRCPAPLWSELSVIVNTGAASESNQSVWSLQWKPCKKGRLALSSTVKHDLSAVSSFSHGQSPNLNQVLDDAAANETQQHPTSETSNKSEEAALMETPSKLPFVQRMQKLAEERKKRVQAAASEKVDPVAEAVGVALSNAPMKRAAAVPLKFFDCGRGLTAGSPSILGCALDQFSVIELVNRAANSSPKVAKAVFLAPLLQPLRLIAAEASGPRPLLCLACPKYEQPSDDVPTSHYERTLGGVSRGTPLPFIHTLAFVDLRGGSLHSVTREGTSIATAVFLPPKSGSGESHSQRLVSCTATGDLEVWEFGSQALAEGKRRWYAQAGGDALKNGKESRSSGIQVDVLNAEGDGVAEGDEEGEEIAESPAGSLRVTSDSDGGFTPSVDSASSSGKTGSLDGATDANDTPGEGTGVGMGAGTGQGIGQGTGSGQGSGGAGAAGRLGNPNGGQGGGKQSDGSGGYAFTADGAAIVKATPPPRRLTAFNTTSQLMTGSIQYDKYLDAIGPSLAHVVQVLEAAETKEKERSWAGFQVQGELDDRRLIDAVIGESNVYKRRRIPPTQLGVPLKKPKRIEFCVDVSASMARFNGWDQRLDRLAEAIVLAMESLRKFPEKFRMSVVGHSGSTGRLPLLSNDADALSTPEKRIAVIDKMISHSRMAATGDGTVECLKSSLESLSKEDADERFLILISDANLGGYDVSVKEVKDIIEPYQHPGGSSTSPTTSSTSNNYVNTSIIFLAEPRAAHYFMKELPAGVAHNCPSTKDLPVILRDIILGAATR